MSKATQQISGRIKIKTQLSASFSVWENIAVRSGVGQLSGEGTEKKEYIPVRPIVMKKMIDKCKIEGEWS